MHFSTLTGACLLALSAFVNNANAYAYGSSVGVDAASSTPIANGAAPTQPAGPNRYSTSVYSTQVGTVKTIQTCTTELCFVKPSTHVAPSITTVYNKPITSTVTKTESGVQYVTKKGQTRTITKITTKSCTSTAKASVQTAYATRVVKVTSVRTASVRKTVTVAPAGESTVVVPTPSGFVYASRDPANAPSNFPPSDNYNKKRYANEPVYPKMIKCTKTLQAISTRTYTAGSKVTSTVYGNTATVTYTKSVTKTVYPQARTTTIIRVSTSTAVSTSTKTTYTTVTKPAGPVTTSYAACNSANIFNGPTGSVGARLGNDSVEVRNVKTPQECCNMCQAHVNVSGVKDCAGSFFGTTNGQSACMLRITNTCSKKNVGMFQAYPNDEEFQGYVSNGPCGRWNVVKYEGNTTPSY
ncbi:uncharacterized protein DFL_005324 [Arthrobotrys flagrans]|uniref:Apple domain-containing protein n=1 Tax=Arthrobotrys flagrans TaxID=97331 RepID=A0A437A7S9_ARTFL|nr:hypothetical protein DFL_005324 [Arthrobotrys flagrans]